VGSVSQTRVGGTVGAGIEWLINPNLSVKAEYPYVDLGKTTFTAIATNPALPLGSSQSIID
jgi:outer membrane immunogenic protein